MTSALWTLPAYTQVCAGLGVATVLPDLDFETYSEAGYVWLPDVNKWGCLPNASQGKKGLTIVGSHVYAQHPSTEVLSMYYDLKDGRGRRRWLPGDPPPHDLFAWVTSGGLLEAWNSGFEYRIWNYVCRRRYGWPELPLYQLRCAMAKARAHSLPGALGPAGDVLQLQYRKDPAGDALLKKFSVPQNPTKKRSTTRIRPADEPEEAARLYAYNERDIVTEAEASSRIPDLDATELGYWMMDQEINMRGVQIDAAGVAACSAIVGQAHAQYNAELAALTGGAVAGASELSALQVWLATQGCRLADMTEETISAALERPDLTPAARRALEIRQLIGSAAVKKLYAMANSMTPAGRMHDLFTYHGAHTGRTTGNGAQPTNLPKSGPEVARCFHIKSATPWAQWRAAGWTEELLLAHGHAEGCRRHFAPQHTACPWCALPQPPGLPALEWSWRAAEDALQVIALRDLTTLEHYFGDAMATVSGCLRGLFVAAPGHDLICSDYSAIEAVVLAMLAGVQWRIDVFRTHGKIYEASAATMAGLPVEEILEHKKRTGSHHPLRAKGKVLELAAGYGGFVGSMIAFGADEFMTEDQMKDSLLAWRAASPEIPEFWGGQWRRQPSGWVPEMYGVEGAFLSAILAPGQVFEYRGFQFRVHEDVLYLTLLSGRHLKYHRPRVSRGDKYGRAVWDISYEGWNTNPKNGPTGWLRRNTYGGRLTENIVQATARDIQWNGMMLLRAAGYPIVLHVYDEDIAEVPEGFGSIEEFERLMSTMPAWAAGWPVRAQGGWRGKRYRKD